ncbi:MAG TPA: MlaD family protein [Polyangia bacterium]|jgi:phospholipid/cholesterol/gamma-HCH transport system substrate-binding protein
MESRVSYTLVGLFVVILGVSAVIVPLWLSRGELRGLEPDRYVVLIRESVAGLSVDAPVRYRGVDVGRVKAIDINPANVEEVRVTIALVHGTPVKVDSFATMRAQGLTGISFIDLEGGTQAAPRLQAQSDEPPVITSRPSLLTKLENTATGVAGNLDRLTADARGVLDEENRRALKEILQNLAKLTHTLERRSGAVDRGITESAAAMAHLARLAARLEATVPPLVQKIDEGAGALRDSAGAIRASAEGIGRTTQSVERVATRTLPELDPLIGELRQVTGSLQRLVAQLEREPGSLVSGRPRVKGPGE